MDVNSRDFYLVYDQYGIDPLLDEKFWAISKISEYSLYIIEHANEARPDLIALDTYDTEELWWLIMQYNGITVFSDLRMGTTIKLPNPVQVSAALDALLEVQSAVPSTVGTTVSV